MKPIEIKLIGHTRKSPQEICAALLNTERWPDFQGYSILPGIKLAYFETRTPDLMGSRIRVQNTDGSSHVEEIIAWDEANRVAFRFQEFSAPLKNLATHFVESWEFNHTAEGTDMSRSMTLFPKGILGWFMLMPISRLMKKAFEKNAAMEVAE
jgi:hypothetical protein